MLTTLLVVGVVVLLAALLYRVLRPAIKLARQVLATIRHLQQVTSKRPAPKGAVEKLVQCRTCQTWIPESRALLADGFEYCSQNCLKLSIAKPRQKKVG